MKITFLTIFIYALNLALAGNDLRQEVLNKLATKDFATFPVDSSTFYFSQSERTSFTACFGDFGESGGIVSTEALIIKDAPKKSQVMDVGKIISGGEQIIAAEKKEDVSNNIEEMLKDGKLQKTEAVLESNGGKRIIEAYQINKDDKVMVISFEFLKRPTLFIIMTKNILS